MGENILNKDIEIKIKTNIRTLREISKFLEEEVVNKYDNLIDDKNISSKEEIEKYNYLKEVALNLCESFYGNLIDAERQIVEKLRERDFERSKIVELLADRKEDKDRIKNIYRALDSVKLDELEKNEIKNKLLKNSFSSLVNLQKIENEVKDDIYIPHLYRFFWCLYDSLDYRGEIIFKENSLEHLLDLEKDELNLFLEKLKVSEVNIGKNKKRLLENYIYLNSNTLKIQYNMNFVKGN
ncbi:hypothetical protein [Cetobacterium sp. SF1]|uniref:hypothetical protein n=1 Tax=unclassified Cetobacterium TaxID=2630983 RepID=UPI003CFBBAE6